MTLSDLGNALLARLRMQGVSFASAPTNTTNSPVPPYQATLFLNAGYSEFLARTQGSPIAALTVDFASVASTQNFSLNPIPANIAGANPAALRVYEMRYVTGGGVAQMYKVPIVSTARFQAIAGGYTRRLGNYGPFPRAATQMFGQRTMEMFPGTALSGDTIELVICPDPANSPALCPASNGGPLQLPADVPIMPSSFHMALVDYAVMQVCDQQNKTDQRDRAENQFEKAVNSALQFAAAYGEGEPEQVVHDTWAVPGVWP